MLKQRVLDNNYNNAGDSHVIFGDGESKLSLLNIREGGPALHLMPNIQVGTGRYRRSHKYHDKNVDKVWVADNGYMVTVSTGSKFVKIWKVMNVVITEAF